MGEKAGKTREELDWEFRRTHSLRSFRPTVEVTSIGEEDSYAREPKRKEKATGGEGCKRKGRKSDAEEPKVERKRIRV